MKRKEGVSSHRAEYTLEKQLSLAKSRPIEEEDK